MNNMKYTGELDDMSAINAYLQKVQEFIEELRAKHAV
jgi:hypothetical protein